DSPSRIVVPNQTGATTQCRSAGQEVLNALGSSSHCSCHGAIRRRSGSAPDDVERPLYAWLPVSQEKATGSSTALGMGWFHGCAGFAGVMAPRCLPSLPPAAPAPRGSACAFFFAPPPPTGIN